MSEERRDIRVKMKMLGLNQKSKSPPANAERAVKTEWVLSSKVIKILWGERKATLVLYLPNQLITDWWLQSMKSWVWHDWAVLSHGMHNYAFYFVNFEMNLVGWLLSNFLLFPTFILWKKPEWNLVTEKNDVLIKKSVFFFFFYPEFIWW